MGKTFIDLCESFFARSVTHLRSLDKLKRFSIINWLLMPVKLLNIIKLSSRLIASIIMFTLKAFIILQAFCLSPRSQQCLSVINYNVMITFSSPSYIPTNTSIKRSCVQKAVQKNPDFIKQQSPLRARTSSQLMRNIFQFNVL